MEDSCDESTFPSSCQGRFTVKKVGAICKGGFHLAIAYLHSSLGLSHPKNLTLLQDIACVLMTLKDPFVLTADFNGTEDDLRRTGFLKLVGGVIFAPKKATCKGRVIDFFVVSQDLAGSVVGVAIVNDALFSPHRPVRLYINANNRTMTVRTLRVAKTVEAKLPMVPPINLCTTRRRMPNLISMSCTLPF